MLVPLSASTHSHVTPPDVGASVMVWASGNTPPCWYPCPCPHNGISCLGTCLPQGRLRSKFPPTPTSWCLMYRCPLPTGLRWPEWGWTCCRCRGGEGRIRGGHSAGQTVHSEGGEGGIGGQCRAGYSERAAGWVHCVVGQVGCGAGGGQGGCEVGLHVVIHVGTTPSLNSLMQTCC